MTREEEDGLEQRTATYLLAFNAAKAAWKAYTLAPDGLLFEECIRATEAFTLARTRLLARLDRTGGKPPDPHLTPPGVSQTHCIK